MSVDEKTAPFEVHEFTSRDAAISVLRTADYCLSFAFWMFSACVMVFTPLSMFLGDSVFVAGSLTFCALNSICLFAGRRVSRELARLTGEDR